MNNGAMVVARLLLALCTAAAALSSGCKGAGGKPAANGSAAASRALRVRTAPVAVRDVTYDVKAVGSLEPEELVQVTAEVACPEITIDDPPPGAVLDRREITVSGRVRHRTPEVGVVVNGVLFALFVISLREEESILLRLVRARGITMSVYGPAYLNRLTAVWAGFFLLNAGVAAWTTTQPLATWTLYNGLIAYLLIGALVAGEWLYRHVVLQRRSAR